MKQRPTGGQPAEILRRVAMQYPEVEEGVACAGTALEKRTIKVRNKAFLFLSANDAMVKLGNSLAAAAELATAEPTRFKVGAHGWVTITFANGGLPPVDLLADWIKESYLLLAPKRLVTVVSERGMSGDATTAGHREVRKKKRS